MGVVYRAEDTRLKRTVALKFLPPELTRDKDAKTRFVHEAQAASALQHHNICTIHEIDETPDGRLFICMECYEGETLKEKIKRGPLPVGEAVVRALCVDSGEALDILEMLLQVPAVGSPGHCVAEPSCSSASIGQPVPVPL